jgi:hypothetical protein
MYLRLPWIVVAFALVSIGWSADIGVSPSRMVLALPPGSSNTGTATVLTTASYAQLVKVAVSDWTLSVSGELEFLPTSAVRYSASDWVLPEAEDISLAPGESREIRLEITVPEDAEGTHHTMVFFAVEPPVTSTPGVGVVTTTRVGLTVYITVAGTERAGSELVDLFQADDRTITAVILNTGNTVMRLGGEIQLRDESGEVRHTLEVPDVPVLRESERELTFDLPDDVEPGFYVALALIQDSRGGVLAGELPLEVP